MTYLLWIALSKDIKIPIGSLGRLNFKRGFYLYIGSAKKGIKARIERHLSKNKTIFWHIDYLISSNDSQIKEIWISPKRQECQIAKFLYEKRFGFINKFGSSDCRCPSHLFFAKKPIKVRNLLRDKGFKNANKNYF